MNISQYNDQQDIPTYKIIIVGKSNAGKTKLLTRYKFGTYTDQGAITIGVDHFIIHKNNAKFAYYDTAGQDKYKSIVSSYYRGSHACLLVYDYSSLKSFEEMAYYYNTIKQTIPQCLIYIVGCKCDKQSQVSQQTIYRYYKGYHHQLTSAKKNQNVSQMFQKLEKQLLAINMQENRGSKIKKDVIRNRDRSKKKCCQ